MASPSNLGGSRAVMPAPRRGMGARLAGAWLCLLLPATPAAAPFLELADAQDHGIVLTDDHSPDDCPYAHAHYLCLQLGGAHSWVSPRISPAPAVEDVHAPSARAEVPPRRHPRHDLSYPRAPPSRGRANS